jgi:hypothetical protein
MFLGSKVRPVRGANNLTAICEPIVQQCGILNISEPYRVVVQTTRDLSSSAQLHGVS